MLRVCHITYQINSGQNYSEIDKDFLQALLEAPLQNDRYPPVVSHSTNKKMSIFLSVDEHAMYAGRCLPEAKLRINRRTEKIYT